MKNNNHKTKIWPFLASFLSGLIVSLAVARGRGLGSGQSPAMNARWLSDGFFVAAVMEVGLGALILISSSTDFFDMISYGFRSLLVLFTPFRKPEDQKSYYEFKLERQKKRVGPKWHLFISGVLLLALALAWFLVYLRLEPRG